MSEVVRYVVERFWRENGKTLGRKEFSTLQDAKDALPDVFISNNVDARIVKETITREVVDE